MRDPIIEEVHEIRHQIEEEYANDSDLFFQHYVEHQKKYQDRLVDSRTVQQHKNTKQDDLH